MKKMKRTVCLCLLCLLLVSLLPAAFAEDAEPAGDERFAGRTWEEITEEFIAAAGGDEDSVSIGYCNTVTGEEHYYAGDRYRDAGSMYKVPLNMVFCERIAAGELDWDSPVRGYSYKYMLHSTIVDSNNENAKQLWLEVGRGEERPYPYYRRTIAPYMGVDPDNVDDKYYENNFFTAEQMIHCLKLLYENPDRFPGIIDEMKVAERSRFFLQHEQSVEVAHKYGLNYINNGNTLVLNDCGIIYTEDPFCLVVCTESRGSASFNQYAFLPNFCTLMIDYTEYQTKQRLAAEEQARLDAAIAALNRNETEEPDSTAAAETQPAPGPSEPQTEEHAMNTHHSFALILILLLTAAALVWLLRLKKSRQLKLVWAIPALLLAAAALLLCVYAPGMKTAVSAPSETVEDPQMTVRAFFDELIAGDYERAYGLLYNYASLGLEQEPETEAARLMSEALRESYSYSFYGECETNDLSARQAVVFEMLDLNLLSEDLKSGTEAAVQKMSEELPQSELLDEDGNYRPEITEKAYLDTLRTLLQHPEKYKTSAGLTIELYYTVDGWRIMAGDPLIFALSGRTAYTRGGKTA